MSVTGWWHSDKNRQKKVRNLGCFAIVLFVGFSCYAFGFGVPDVLILRSIPVPANAEVVIDGREFIFTEFGFENEIMYRIDQAGPEILAYYREGMSKRGWQLIGEKGHGPSMYKSDKMVTKCLVFSRYDAIDVGVNVLEIENIETGKERAVVNIYASAGPPFFPKSQRLSWAFNALGC